MIQSDHDLSFLVAFWFLVARPMPLTAEALEAISASNNLNCDQILDLLVALEMLSPTSAVEVESRHHSLLI
ncbi:hypothetical protein M758_UG129200 [Ceratodon purpureus]|nr:hypothetical protein M758_UG129200 [Ceratodon purpureus]